VTAANFNSFERIMFWFALGIAGVVVVLRVGAMVFVYLHH